MNKTAKQLKNGEKCERLGCSIYWEGLCYVLQSKAQPYIFSSLKRAQKLRLNLWNHNHKNK